MSCRRPNFPLFLGEHHRWDWLGAEGKVPVRTPNLDGLAQRGVRFRQCRAASPMCAPSRACLATGRRYHRAGVPANRSDLDPSLPNFMKVLRADGYRVAVCGKTDLHKKSHLHGITGWSRRLGRLGFTDAVDQCGKRDSALLEGRERPIEPYMAFLHSRGLAEVVCEDLRRRMRREEEGGGIDTRPFPLERYYQLDDFCGRCALELLDALPRGEPWLLQVNWASAHPPFDAAEELLRRYDGVEFPQPVAPGPGPNDHAAIRRQYAAMLEGMDEWIGRVLDAVARRGELEETVVIYTADHGEMLGDHGLWNKGCPLEGSTHVPLLMCGPDLRSGVVSEALVELIDVAPTVLEAAGLDVPEGFDACSLTPLLAGETEEHREAAVSAFGPWRMVCRGRWKFSQEEGGPDRLYDLVADPSELCNFAEANPKQIAELRRRQSEEFARPLTGSARSQERTVMMNYRRFGRTELQVSEVGLGALEMGAPYGIGEESGQVPSEEQAFEVLQAAWDAGITLFDTAGVYGLSEYRIGRWLERTGEHPVITTKFGVQQGEDGEWLDYAAERPFESIRACVDHQVQRSLHNLGVEAIDVMQYHGLPAEEDVFGETLEALRAHVKTGRIRFLGASCSGSKIPQVVAAGDLSTVQLGYNMLDQAERHNGLPLAEEHDLGVLVRIPLALGVLGDKLERLDEERRRRFKPFLDELRGRLPEGMSVPEAALRFVSSTPGVTAPLCGTRNPAHAREAGLAGDGRGLPEEVFNWVCELEEQGELPQWSWDEHYERDWPTGAIEANRELCRSVDI